MSSSSRRVVAVPAPTEQLEFTGERFTMGLSGEIEHEHLHRYMFALQVCRGRDVLDVASGEGYGSALLATVARSVIGVELVDDVVKHARSSYPGENLAYRVGDARELPIDSASIDVVVSFETLEHVDGHARLLAEFKRVLRPGGLLVMSSPVRGIYSPGNPNPFHVKELTVPELRKLVSSSFRESVYLGQTPVVGSAILPEVPDSGRVSTHQLFWRAEDGTFETETPLSRSPYVIVVASDAAVPPLDAGLLQDRPFMARLFGELSKARADASDRARALAEAQCRLDELADARMRMDELERRNATLEARIAAHDREAQRRALEPQPVRTSVVRALKDALIPSSLRSYARRRRVLRRLLRSGLFDSAYYLAANPDVDATRRTALRHYLVEGAAQGRDPHPMFDTSYYLDQNPELAAGGTNPLLHFANRGAAEGRRPHPRHTAQEYLAAASQRRRKAPPGAPTPRPVPAWTFRPTPLPEAADGNIDPSPLARTIVVTHVLPFPPRAGNEYRIDRMVRWLRSIGHEVHVVLCPLPGDVFDPINVAAAAREYGNLVLCERDGTVRYRFGRSEVRSAIRSLAGIRPRSFPAPALPGGPGSQPIMSAELTFCPDFLIDVLLRLEQAIKPDVVISNYVFMSRSLPVLDAKVLRIIDTHDVFSTKSRKVVRFGIRDDLAMTGEVERAMLGRADVAVAIQPEEQRELEEIAPGLKIVTAGVDFELPEEVPPPPSEPVVAYVASSNALNVKGIRDFLSLAWPLVRRDVPTARLLLIGPVCDAVDSGVDGVELRGRVDRLDAVYAQARVVINPAVAGTGLKIKTLEALMHLRPVVVWPSGIDGLNPAARRLCHVAHDWYDFGRRVTALLTGDGASQISAHGAEIRRELSRDAVYADLGAAIEAGIRVAAARGKRDR